MDPKAIGTALAKATREHVEKELRSRDSRIAELEARLAQVEAGGIKYLGVWKPDTLYAKGSFATRQGSVWHANCETFATPGASPDWTLAVKAGKDAR